MKTQKKSGFTLIEMLIVVAIIGILAALLSGPLMRARRSAQLVGCTNNLKQIGTGLNVYSTDRNKDVGAVRTSYAGMVALYNNFSQTDVLGDDFPPALLRCPVEARSTVNAVAVASMSTAGASYGLVTGSSPVVGTGLNGNNYQVIAGDNETEAHQNGTTYDGITALSQNNEAVRLDKGTAGIATDDLSKLVR